MPKYRSAVKLFTLYQFFTLYQVEIPSVNAIKNCVKMEKINATGLLL